MNKWMEIPDDGSSLPQVDHDVCSNYGNWLYSAGLGNDPRENRKFNMIKQGLDYDADVSRVWSVSQSLRTDLTEDRPH